LEFQLPGASLGAGTVFTGDTGSELALVTPHLIGATSYQSGQTLGLAYNLIGGSTAYRLAMIFPTGISYPTISYLMPFYTTIPQNDTNLNAYTLDQFNDTSATNEYVAAQLQSNGSALNMALECKSNSSSGTVPISTSTLYYLQVIATSGAPVTSFTGTTGTLTFTNSGINGFSSGEQIVLSGFAGGNTGLNTQSVTVLSAGLSSTSFEAAVTGSGYSTGAGGAAGYHTLKVYNSSGTQVGSTITCAAPASTMQFTQLALVLLCYKVDTLD
jgi:hypothetical protein